MKKKDVESKAQDISVKNGLFYSHSFNLHEKFKSRSSQSQ